MANSPLPSFSSVISSLSRGICQFLSVLISFKYVSLSATSFSSLVDWLPPVCSSLSWAIVTRVVSNNGNSSWPSNTCELNIEGIYLYLPWIKISPKLALLILSPNFLCFPLIRKAFFLVSFNIGVEVFCVLLRKKISCNIKENGVSPLIHQWTKSCPPFYVFVGACMISHHYFLKLILCYTQVSSLY